MKKTATLIVAFSLLLLQGCAHNMTPAQRVRSMTPQERKAYETSTLKVHDDNRVAFEAHGMDAARGGQHNVWAWSNDKDVVLALKIDGSYYNLQDISKITIYWPTTDGEREWNVLFKDGTSKRPVYNRWKEAQRTQWATCDRQKNCTEGNRFVATSIGDEYLNATKFYWGAYDKDPQSIHFLMNSISMPVVGGTNAHWAASIIEFVDAAKREALIQQLQDMKTRFYGQRTEAAEEAQKFDRAANLKWEQDQRTIQGELATRRAAILKQHGPTAQACYVEKYQDWMTAHLPVGLQAKIDDVGNELRHHSSADAFAMTRCGIR